MILPISSNYSNRRINFSAKNEEEKSVSYDKDTLLENNFSTRARIGMDKFIKAFTVYPAKGLNGSKNSNFYEFLTMGTMPYIIGSLTLMAMFNGTNKKYSPFEAVKASSIGQKMALGVVLYALFKSISKSFINVPVRAMTGIDTQLPYAKVNYQLQESPDDYNLTSIEYHKVGESVDFPYWTLLYGNPAKGEKLNFRFDKIAKKNGLGENLNDSDQEVKPMYKEVLVKSSLARSFSSYLWAATGVALAFQKPWEAYFRIATLKFWKPKEFAHSLKIFGECFVKSAQELYNGPVGTLSKFEKHAGKALLATSLGVTLLGIANAVHITKKPSRTKASDVIDSKKESVVS